ncbi:hypothetical protein [Lysobacter gummosus]|uniref:hypothetical protein n=1 Tax=Lysobacter gummosus TaxID=262324 RepID=UPI00362D0802
MLVACGHRHSHDSCRTRMMQCGKAFSKLPSARTPAKTEKAATCAAFSVQQPQTLTAGAPAPRRPWPWAASPAW